MTTIFAYFLWLLTLLGLPLSQICQIADVDLPACEQSDADDAPPIAMLPGGPGGTNISNGF
jgi:hypothetical protein